MYVKFTLRRVFISRKIISLYFFYKYSELLPLCKFKRTDDLSIFTIVSRTREQELRMSAMTSTCCGTRCRERAKDSSPVFSGAKATKTNPGGMASLVALSKYRYSGAFHPAERTFLHNQAHNFTTHHGNSVILLKLATEYVRSANFPSGSWIESTRGKHLIVALSHCAR